MLLEDNGLTLALWSLAKLEKVPSSSFGVKKLPSTPLVDDHLSLEKSPPESAARGQGGVYSFITKATCAN